jgi:hypothetical protein
MVVGQSRRGGWHKLLSYEIVNKGGSEEKIIDSSESSVTRESQSEAEVYESEDKILERGSCNTDAEVMVIGGVGMDKGNSGRAHEASVSSGVSIARSGSGKELDVVGDCGSSGTEAGDGEDEGDEIGDGTGDSEADEAESAEILGMTVLCGLLFCFFLHIEQLQIPRQNGHSQFLS